MEQSAEKDIFDPAYAERVAYDVIEPIAKYYFRMKVIGLDKIPGPYNGRPIIFFANHAGRTFPWDAILLDYRISCFWHKHFNMAITDKPRTLVAPVLSRHPRLLPFRLKDWWHVVGGVDARTVNFDELLSQGKHVIIFPEGIPGIARDFNRLYQLLPFRTSLARLARKHNALLVPVTIVGSEYFHPLARSVDFTEKIGKRLGLPFLPLSPITSILPLCPWLLWSALPSTVTIVIEDPVEPESAEPYGDDWGVVADHLRQHLQTHLDLNRARYEKRYQLKGLVSSLRRAPEHWWRYLPFYWPFRFINHARKHAPAKYGNTTSPWWFMVPLAGLFNPPRRSKLFAPVKPVIQCNRNGYKPESENILEQPPLVAVQE